MAALASSIFLSSQIIRHVSALMIVLRYVSLFTSSDAIMTSADQAVESAEFFQILISIFERCVHSLSPFFVVLTHFTLL